MRWYIFYRLERWSRTTCKQAIYVYRTIGFFLRSRSLPQAASIQSLHPGKEVGNFGAHRVSNACHGQLGDIHVESGVARNLDADVAHG